MMEWKEVRLGDVYDVHNGLSKGGKFFGSGFPFLTFSVVFNNYFVPEELSSLVQSTEKERLSCSIKAGDVFITRTSETAEELGMSCVALKDYPNATYNGFTKRLRKKDDCQYEVDSRYIGYYLRSRKFRSLFMGLSGSMSTRASLANGDLLNMPVSLPSLSDQRRIASILSSLDKKIETNNKINANLEEMAQAIFKNWFVDFAPFKDGKFVESELGMIPEGWRVVSLTSIANFMNGLAMQKFPPTEKENSYPVLKIKELGQGMCDASSDRCSKDIKQEYIIKNGDVIFSWSGTLLVDVWCGGICGLNQHLFKVTSAEYPKWFYLYWTKHHLANFIHIAKDKAVTMGHIKRSHLDEALVIVPSIDDMKKASAIFEPIVKKIISLRIENQQLATLRDTLLPRLMSGEIEV